MSKYFCIKNLIPRNFFVTSGKGESDITINAGSYHMALEDAGIACCNIMKYSSILPSVAIEITKPDLVHGAELRAIEARADVEEGQMATAGVCYGWLYDKDGRKCGGIVAEYGGNKNVQEAKQELRLALEDIAKNSFNDMRLDGVFTKMESFVPEKRYGTAIVSLCFVDYLVPIIKEKENS